MPNKLDNHKANRKLTSLVENCTTYSSQFSELNIYETHAYAEKVHLKFDTPIIASMLTGKKIMHLKGMQSFEFIPGESVVVPANEQLIIDFPIATTIDPTQCLALSIDQNKIKEIASNFNEHVAIENENNTWAIDNLSSHLTNQQEVNLLLDRLIQTYTHNVQSKDMLLDLMIQELIIRLLQTKAKNSILDDPNGVFSDTRIGTVIKYIKEHLTEKKITVELLAKKAYMSTSNFHIRFKDTLGLTPIDYINAERIKFAKRLIAKDNKMAINEVAFKSGFNSVSYFNRQFKKHELIIPSQYKKIVKSGKT